jgi:arginine exporter protein ArgO
VTAGLVAGLLAGYGIAVPVGAIATYLVALTARTSLRVGCAGAVGVASADGLYALAAMLGGSALASQLSRFATPMRVAAAGVLIAVAVRTATLAIRRRDAPALAHATSDGRLRPSRAYAGLFGLTLVNPTTIVYFTALVAGNRSAAVFGQPLAQGLFVVAAFTASASWQLLLAGSGAALGRILTGQQGRLISALVSSLVIVALALRLLLAS